MKNCARVFTRLFYFLYVSLAAVFSPKSWAFHDMILHSIVIFQEHIMPHYNRTDCTN